MDKEALAKRLEPLGLPHKDAIVYLALLSLGAATVQQITKETDLNRSSLYVVLDRLMKRGFVSIASEQGIRRYVSASPERLAQAAKEQAENSELLKQNLTLLLPKLTSTHKGSQHRPRVEVFDGKEGLIKGFEESLSCEEEFMRVVSSGTEIFRTIPEYLPLYVEKRIRKGMGMQGIHPAEKIGMTFLKNAPVPPNLDQHVFIPEDNYHFPADLGIYDNKTAFMSHKFLFTALIESKEIAAVMKAAFDLAWQTANRIGEKYP